MTIAPLQARLLFGGQRVFGLRAHSIPALLNRSQSPLCGTGRSLRTFWTKKLADSTASHSQFKAPALELFFKSYSRDRLVESVLLFTRNLHMQSNVYFCLQLRRFSQLVNLYQRIYSPNDISQILHRSLRSFQDLTNSLTTVQSFFKRFARSSYLTCFASVSLFSWDEHRITDKDMRDLIEDFLIFEKLQESEEDDQDSEDSEADTDSKKKASTSYMIVNCLESEEEKTQAWEIVINRPHFHVWRKAVDKSSLYEYKVFGTFYDISAYSFFTVQRDLEYRKSWDKLVIRLDIINHEPDSLREKLSKFVQDSRNEVVHWIMKFPYPMRSREYIFLRRSRMDYERNFIVTLSRSVEYPEVPECADHVRVYDYVSQMVIKPHGNSFYKNGFDYMLTYFDDPRASFPSPAYSWMASRGVPDFVEKMHQAALVLREKKEDDWIQLSKQEKKIRREILTRRSLGAQTMNVLTNRKTKDL